ncbi:MAG: hypothetical protein AAB074_16230 [Planctomycetota bacterium]
MKAILPALAVVLLASCGKDEEGAGTSGARTGPSSAGAPVLQVQTGRFFRFAVPSGWRVQDEGQFAVVLVAPDGCAFTVMAGNSGLPANYPPGQFAQEKILQMQVQDLRLGPASMARPMAGCSSAWEFEYSYTVGGAPCRGMAKCSVASTYDMCTMVVTLAASQEPQWSGYSTWLPAVAEQVAAINGAAFGARGVMQQNLENSINLGEQARRNREWSATTWGQVNRERAASQDRQATEFRENLGNVQTWTNPFDSGKVELPATFSNYWINRQGRIVGTNNPGEDPNNGSTEQWLRMNPIRR